MILSKLRSSLDDVFNNLNTHPVPMEFSKGLTTGERLDSIYSLIVEYLDVYETFETDVTEDIKSSLDLKYKEIENLIIANINGKLTSKEVVDKLKILLDVSYADTFKYITFGLSDDGYFVAYVPDVWEVEFDTIADSNSSDYGKLMIKY